MYRPRIATQALALCVLLLASLAPLTASANGQAAPQQAEGASGNPCLGQSAELSYNGSCGPEFQLPRWSDADNWSQPQYYETILLADFNGDGADELLARSAVGFEIHTWDAALGQWQDKGPQAFPSPWSFSDIADWDLPQYYSTIQAAELGYNGGTAASLLLNSASGIYAFQWDGDRTWIPLQPGPAWIWSDVSNYSTIQTWKNWLIGRGPLGVETWRFVNNAWQPTADNAVEIFSNSQGWHPPQYYETIKIVDLEGDGTPELLGRSSSGMLVFTWEGSDWSAHPVATKVMPFPDDQGWAQAKYYQTIQYANVDDDPNLEMFARGSGGLMGYQWTGSDWQPMDIAAGLFPDDQDWGSPYYYQTIRFLTLDSDAGVDTLAARAGLGLFFYTYAADSKAFGPPQAGPALANGSNSDYPMWMSPGYYRTIHYGDVNGDGADDLIARGMFGLRTWTFNSDSTTWERPVAYGFSHFSEDAGNAYTAVNNLLGPFATPQNDPTIRGQYSTTDAPTLNAYKATLEAQSAPPSGCGAGCADAWPQVRQQIINELEDAYWTASYFSELATLFGDVFADGDDELTTIAQQLMADSKSSTRMAGFMLQLFLAGFTASGAIAGPTGRAVTGFLASALGATAGLTSADFFEGTLVGADQQYTTHRQQIMDQLQNERVYVAADAGLMSTVARARRTAVWNPSDPWVIRATVSTGRKQVAIWSYQAIAPSLWVIVGVYYESIDCDRDLMPADDVRFLYIGDNDGDCYLDVETRSVFGALAPKGEVENILLADTCVPTQSNSVSWEYGACNLGMDVHDFFFREGGWNFRYTRSCAAGCPQGAGLEVQPYHADKKIQLGRTGTLPVALFGTPELDVLYVDPATVTFAGAPAVGWWIPAEPSSAPVVMPPSAVRDINGDGFDDLILHFTIQQLQLVPGLNTVTMTGSLTDGTAFSASGTADAFCVNNC